MDKSDKRTASRSERRAAHWEQSHRLNQERFDYRTGILASPSEVDAAEWNALLAQQSQPTPFLRHEFLSALHATRCAVADSGWAPQFVTLTDPRTDKLVAAAPVYLKGHSYGEYVFDWA
jgi:predicted N-acyltransferase